MYDGTPIDDETLARARRGDAEAFAEICKALQPSLVALVKRRMGRRAHRWIDAEDVVQDVLGEMAPETPSFASVGDLVRYARRRATWRLQDEIRRCQRLAGESDVAGGAAEDVPRRTTGSVTRDDDLRWLRRLHAHLTGRHATIVQMCAIDGLSYAEAARRLDTTEEAVRKAYERARQKLKEIGRRHRRDEGRG